MSTPYYVQTPAGRLHLREAGSGTPLLLLHQTPSSSATYEPVLDLLAPSLRAIAIDTPGFGASEPPPSRPVGIDGYGDAAVAALDALGVERAFVAGFHSGASIALDIATRHADRTHGVVLAGLLTSDTDADRDRWRTLAFRDWTPDPDGAFVTETLLPWARSLSGGEDGRLLQRELIDALRAGPDYWWAYEAIIAFDALERLDRLTVPALFLNAVEDGAINATTRAAADRVPASRYRELPGGMDTIARHPDAFARELLAFVTDKETA